MKVSINGIRDFNKRYGCADDPAPYGIDDLLQKIGAQLGGIEEVHRIGAKYDGVIIVKVMSCENHPNADRLHVCMVDDGGKTPDVPRNENGHVQVVCGAPNVTAGVTVAWLPPGCTVPSTYEADPYVLEARELRGVISNGMLASPKELAIGDNHDGLLLIDEEIEPGTMFTDHFGLRDDVVIDIENKMFTHRPDCFGWMGVAREIAGIQGQQFKSPEWYRSDASVGEREVDELKLEVRNELPDLVPRFTAVTMANITIEPSPVWLQVELSRVGVRPINNIVDFTNYFMLETGQPLHAYDYDKVVAQDSGADHATLVVRHPHKGEKIRLLSGKEIEPRGEAIMIATTTQAIGLGGVMGGGDTEVDEHTKNIILECANFDMYSIRRTAMAHGIFTDAVTRFNKGQSPLQNMAVLAKIVDEIRKRVGGKVASDVIDDNHLAALIKDLQSLSGPITVPVQFINDRLGLRLTDQEMIQLLTNVEFHGHDLGNQNEICVQAPFWRTDIEIPEDIVEEIGRLYGYDKLPLELPKRTITPAIRDSELEAKSAARTLLSRAGANEVLTYSFVHGNILDRAGQDRDTAFKLSNALSPDLQYYRLSLTPSLLDKVHMNIKAGYDAFAIFEIGKTHSKTELAEDGLPKEFGRIGLVYAAAPKKAIGSTGATYYQAVAYLNALLPSLDQPLVLKQLSESTFGDYAMFDQLCRPFEPTRSALVFAGEMLLGVVGEYKTSVQKALKLPQSCAGFEIFLSSFQKLQSAGSRYIAIPRFPKVTQDISLKVPSDRTYKQVYEVALAALPTQDDQDVRINLSPLDIFQRDDDPGHKQIALRLQIASHEKTMTDNEVAGMLDTVAEAAKSQLGAERI